MHNIRSKSNNAKIEKELLKHRRSVSKCYREGYSLGELCREFRLDISSVLLLLKRSKLKKKKLYIVFKNQTDRTPENKEIINIKEKQYIEKFFPASESSSMGGGYYWHWREEYKKRQQKKEHCNHTIRHIRCGRCNKILRDA